VFVLRRDMIVSVIGHCGLLVAIIIFNPSRGMFRGTPDMMTVDLSQLTPAGAGRGEAPKAIAASKPAEEEAIAPKEKTPAKKDKTEKNAAVKDNDKSTEMRGLDVSRKVGNGSGEGEGENIGGSNLPYDMGLVTSILNRSWRNPVTASTPITCTIYCQIGRDGNIVGEPIVEKSSGISTFDQAAIFAFKRAGQFPPFPADFDYDYIGLHLEFVYAP
jgi:TonB family protein